MLGLREDGGIGFVVLDTTILVFEIETWVLGAHGCFRVRYSLHFTISVKK